jgi:hypothetical protein
VQKNKQIHFFFLEQENLGRNLTKKSWKIKGENLDLWLENSFN